MSDLGINELVKLAYDNADTHGFHAKGPMTTERVLARLSLIHAEVSEAVEDARQIEPTDLNIQMMGEGGKPVGFPSEMADIIIRIADLCGELNIDLNRAVMKKMAYNATRPFMHGKKA